MRAVKLLGDKILDGRTAGMALKLAGLLVQPPQGPKLFIPAELRLLHGRLQHLDGLVIDLDGYRKRTAVLSAMSNREASRVGDPVRRAIDGLGHQREGLHGPSTNAWRQQQIGKILRSAVSGGGEISMKPPCDHVAAPDIVMGRHHQVRQEWLRDGCPGPGPTACFKRRKFTRDLVRSQGGEHIDLREPGRLGPPVGKIDDFSLSDPLDRGMRIIDEARQSL